MKKIVFLVSVFCLVSFLDNSFAAKNKDTDTGTLINTGIFIGSITKDKGSKVDINDDEDNVESLLSAYFEKTVDVFQYRKAESTNKWLDGAVTGEDKKLGTWNFGETVYFYTVKSGPGFELYWIENGAASGDWAQTVLTQGSMSHVAGWKYVPNNNTPVPVPASLFLLGSGLVGVFPLARRNRNKKI